MLGARFVGLPTARIRGQAEQVGHGAFESHRQLRKLGDVETRAVLQAAQRLVRRQDAQLREPTHHLLLGEAKLPSTLA
ncbi:hypothetical protein [Thermasporomyces composti]|uniref:hypothetical protein n=1 Tax=Thermasporomyces composti TaxID=696763 RepID=UPI00147560C3|nr:hypothetical protein [Thermasporomyces composti]